MGGINLDSKIYSVAIDGPAGAGKSTIAKKVANILNIEYIDTGAMFRAITLKVLNEGIDPKDSKSIIAILASTDIDFIDNTIYLDNQDVSLDIRENEISKMASHIAKIREVRTKLLELQRDIAKNKSVVMDGRDIATIVLPEADHKFYLTASVDKRADRRYKELVNKNSLDISYESIKDDIIKRDRIDSSREIAPLKQAKDAILIDSSDLNIDQTVDSIVSIILGR